MALGTFIEDNAVDDEEDEFDWLTPDWESNPKDTNEVHHFTPEGTQQWFYDTDPRSNQLGRLSRKGVLDLTTFDSANIFRNLISQLSAPGGVLSSVQEGRRFGSLATGTQKALETGLGDMYRAIRSGGLSPGRARQSMRSVSFDAMRDLLGRRSEIAHETEMMRADALGQLANVQAAQEMAEKDRTLSYLSFDRNYQIQREAQSKNFRNQLFGGLIGGAAQLGGAALQGPSTVINTGSGG